MKKKKGLDPKLLAEFRKEAKRADQRMIRLEQRVAENPGKYGEILQYAYKRAIHDINDYSIQNVKSDQSRFNRLEGITTNAQLRGKLKAAKRFNESASSTISGIRTIYAKKAASLNKRYKKEKLNISSNTLAKIFDSGLWDKMKDAGYDSDTIFKTIAFTQRNKKKIANRLKQHDKIHLTSKEIRFAENAPTPRADSINKILNENKRTISDLINNEWISAPDWDDIGK